MKKIKINLRGNTVEGESMTFTAREEPWTVYKLEDGSIIKLRPVVSDIFKLPERDPVTGLPQYMIRSSNIVSVEPPDVPLSKKEIQ
jgi:hypothetical protein